MQNKPQATSCDLENMTISELETLLQKDFSASDTNQPDVDFVMEVMRVILQKEKEQGTYVPVDVDKAWADFQEYYNTEDSTPKKSLSSKRRISRTIMIAAVIAVLIAMSTIPVLGYQNVFQMIGEWTAEQFHFVSSNSTSKDTSQFSDLQADASNEEFSSIYEALAAYGIDNEILPNTIPNSYVQTEFYVTEAASGRVRFFARYSNSESYFTFTVTKHTKALSSTYEKTANPVEIYIEDGITYYLFSNNCTETAAYYIDNIEYSISTNLPRAQLKALITF